MQIAKQIKQQKKEAEATKEHAETAKEKEACSTK